MLIDSLSHRRGFTLIELMVIIAVIALLSAFAIPSYKKNVIRSRLHEGITLLERIRIDVLDYYNAHGAFPSPLKSTLGTVTANSSLAVDTENVAYLYYNVGSTVTLCASMKDIGISGSTLSTNGNNGTYNRLCLHIRYVNNLPESMCGRWGDSTDVPLEYLPRNCNCSAVGSWTC